MGGGWIVSWEGGKVGRIVRCQDGKGSRVAMW